MSLNNFFHTDEALDWDDLLNCGFKKDVEIKRKMSESLASTASFGLSIVTTSNKSCCSASSKQHLEDEYTSDDEDIFGSMQSAVQLIVDEFDVEKEDIFQHPYFQSSESSPAVSTPRDALKMNLDPLYQPPPGYGPRGVQPAAVAIQPHPYPPLPSPLSQARVIASKAGEKQTLAAPPSTAVPSFPPTPPALMAPSMMEARTLPPKGLISIGGQAYLLLPVATAAQVEAGILASPPLTASQPRRFSQSPLKFVPDTSLPTGLTLPDSRKEPAHSFPNIQVLSEKVDSSVEHGYYLSEAGTSQEAKGTPREGKPVPCPADDTKPDPKPLCFPTYTYDYGTEVDKTVWDILRKSLRPSS